jgi:hypothetical protein
MLTFAAEREHQKESQTTQAGGAVSTVEHFLQQPDKLRIVSESGKDAQKEISVHVSNGPDRWNTVNGVLVKLTTGPDPSPAYVEDFVQFYGPRAMLRLKDPAYRVSLVDEIKVGDRPAVGVRITRAAPHFKLDLKCYFDKETGLLLKEENCVNNLETLYSDYKKFEGLPVPQKITRKVDGQVLIDIQVIEFRATDQLDPTLFQRQVAAKDKATARPAIFLQARVEFADPDGASSESSGRSL